MNTDIASGSTHPLPFIAIALVALCAMLWGLYWIPVAVLENRGVNGSWAALTLGLGGLVASVPLLIHEARTLRGRAPSMHWRQWLGGLAIGVAITFYSIGISYSDVVRVILLFYLAPAWSTLIECVFMGRRWSWASVLGLLLSLLGMVVVFRGELPLEGIGALGDWMALMGGMAWAIGATLVFSGGPLSLPRITALSQAAAALVAVCALIFLSGQSQIDQWSVDASRGWWFIPLIAVLIGLVYLVPTTYGTMWGATRIPPTTLTFLLTFEVVSGVLSAAVFLDQPYGLPEFAGTVLILSGALVEVIFQTRRRR